MSFILKKVLEHKLWKFTKKVNCLFLLLNSSGSRCLGMRHLSNFTTKPLDSKMSASENSDCSMGDAFHEETQTSFVKKRKKTRRAYNLLIDPYFLTSFRPLFLTLLWPLFLTSFWTLFLNPIWPLFLTPFWPLFFTPFWPLFLTSFRPLFYLTFDPFSIRIFSISGTRRWVVRAPLTLVLFVNFH